MLHLHFLETINDRAANPVGVLQSSTEVTQTWNTAKEKA
jgi:hypothetical protein